MLDVILDAVPAVIAFVLISLLTFIGWGIRGIWKFSHAMQELIHKEMTNGKPAGQGESTKDILGGIRDSLVNHDAWAREDAIQRNASLEKQREILREHQELLKKLAD